MGIIVQGVKYWPGDVRPNKRGILMRRMMNHWQPIGVNYRDSKTGRFVKWETV